MDTGTSPGACQLGRGVIPLVKLLKNLKFVKV